MRVSSLGILGIALGLATPATAQTVKQGTWTGTLDLANGPTIQVEFTVQGEGESLQIVMKAVNGPPQPLTDVELSDKAIAFTWGAFTCSLKRKSDSKYDGECGGAADGQLSLEAPSGKPSSVKDVVTGEQLVATEQPTVYEALRQLRPRWLRSRAGSSRTSGERNEVMVYVGGQRMGTVDFLRTLDPRNVAEIRVYSASDATTIFGTGNMGGAIAITRR